MRAIGVIVAVVLGGVVLLRLQGTDPVLRTVPAGVMPWCVVVDERTGRAFVANTNVDVLGNNRPIPTPPDGIAWQHQLVRGLKQHLPWLPVTLPTPRPAGQGSVTVLDLSRL